MCLSSSPPPLPLLLPAAPPTIYRRVCALRWQVHAWRLAQQGLDGRHDGEPRHPPRLLSGWGTARLESLGACARLGGAGRPYPARPRCAHALRDGAHARPALTPELGALPPRTLAHQPLTSQYLGTLPPELGALPGPLSRQAARLARSPRASCARPRLDGGGWAQQRGGVGGVGWGGGGGWGGLSGRRAHVKCTVALVCDCLPCRLGRWGTHPSFVILLSLGSPAEHVIR